MAFFLVVLKDCIVYKTTIQLQINVTNRKAEYFYIRE